VVYCFLTVRYFLSVGTTLNAK